MTRSETVRWRCRFRRAGSPSTDYRTLSVNAAPNVVVDTTMSVPWVIILFEAASPNTGLVGAGDVTRRTSWSRT